MVDRKWGAISSGATFETLVTTLVFFEHPDAALFGRRGVDGGQDARSGDGVRVFQAKHHADGSAAKAIADAKKEAAKILGYRSPEHPRHSQWKTVKHWRLVTNATFNPTDRHRWDNEVVPVFEAQGLVADYWERANLDALLDKNPEVDRAFFENETRAFLSLPELRERLPTQEPFLQRPALGEFFGREVETVQFRDFLASEKLFLVVHGAGGIGKTRLLVESGELFAAEGDWQVLWANVASMTATSAWFEAIVPERATLLLVDEPPDERILQQLSEQLGGRTGRSAKWKVAIAVRSQRDPVLGFLRAPRIRSRMQELPITALPLPAAEAMCNDLLRSGATGAISDAVRHSAARELARRFGRHPVWLTLAVHVLESRGELSEVPSTAQDLAASYLDEVTRRNGQDIDPATITVLRWVALLGTVNRADDATITLIGEGSAVGDLAEVRARLASLVARRVLVERGAERRLVELNPTVLRDHVLLSWLTINLGYGEIPIVPSLEAKRLAGKVRGAMLAGNISALELSILVSLARTERLLQLEGSHVSLLDDFFQDVRGAVDSMSASRRIALAEVLGAIAAFRPVDTTVLTSAMRLSIAETETLERSYRSRTLGHDDVLLELAWPVWRAATGAQSYESQLAVLTELCALTEAEAEVRGRRPQGLPNDGKRAAALVTRVLEGGPQFWGDYDAAARECAELVLRQVERNPPSSGDTDLLKALVGQLLSTDRRQTWSDEDVLHIRTYSIHLEHPAWATREVVLARLKSILASDDTPLQSRIALWTIFAKAHGSLNWSRGGADAETGKLYLPHLQDDLVWANDVLTSSGRSIEELKAARALWHWDHGHATDTKVRAASEQLERLYVANGLADEFEPLVSRGDWQELEGRAFAKAQALATQDDAAAIDAFVDRAIRFLGNEAELSRFWSIALGLGRLAPSYDGVRAFVRSALSLDTASPRVHFAADTAASWVAVLRKGARPADACSLVVELLSHCSDEERKSTLLQRLYGGSPRPAYYGELTPEEHQLVRSVGPLFLAQGRGPTFIAMLGVTLRHEWESLRLLVEDALSSIPGAQLAAGLAELVEAVSWVVHDSASSVTPLPRGLGQWLLEQIIRLPDLDELGGNVEWYIADVLRQVERVPFSWLPGALAKRIERERQEGSENFSAVSHHARLSKYVAPISVADAEMPQVARAVRALVDFASDKGSVGYSLPEVLRDVDPEGVAIPDEVARRVSVAVSPEELRALARIGGAYSIGSAPWRAIAKPVIARGAAGGSNLQRSLFRGLADRGIRTWSGTVGQVPTIFLAAVETAKQSLETELDLELVDFWKWSLEIAESELRDQEERSKEERGE
jgi:hypothetical protein